eukprot:3344957-Amphidinium_carterae.1
MVRPADFVAATIRLICQESGGEIEPESLHVTIQGCMSDSLEEILAQEHQLVVTTEGSKSQAISGTRARAL